MGLGPAYSKPAIGDILIKFYIFILWFYALSNMISLEILLFCRSPQFAGISTPEEYLEHCAASQTNSIPRFVSY